MTRVLVLQNADNAPLALVGAVLAREGVHTQVLLMESGAAVLPADDAGFDALIVLGGHQDAFDDVANPFIVDEMALIRRFHAADKPILAICLGAQLLTRALGGQVFRNPAGIEWGFMPFTLTEHAQDDALLGDGGMPPIMQCHIDTYTLPPGAVRLVTGAHTLEQGFRIGRASYGFQSHFEVTREVIAEWEPEVVPVRGWDAAETAADIDAQFARHFAAAAHFAEQTTRRWLSLASAV
jgi:GMP synthase (glutamine-hydrolysing)